MLFIPYSIVYAFSIEQSLLVDPVLGVRLPVKDLALLEPESNLLLGILHRVRSVADIPSDLNAEIAADGARLRSEGVGGAEHLPSGADGLLALPNHAHDGSGHHVIAELREERLLDQVAVVGVEELLSGLTRLHGRELVSLGLEPRDDVADDTALNSIGFDLSSQGKPRMNQ